jgi:hypothetical protein
MEMREPGKHIDCGEMLAGYPMLEPSDHYNVRRSDMDALGGWPVIASVPDRCS